MPVKKSKSSNEFKPNRTLQIMFIIFSILLILSMVLSLTVR
jgi:hypothetical protein